MGYFLKTKLKRRGNTTKENQLRVKSIPKIIPSKAAVHKDSKTRSLENNFLSSKREAYRYE